MAARAEAGGEGRAPWWPVLGLAALAGALWAIRADLPGFYDNEGRYAAVAWEMLARGDWVTPRMDGTLFLNKPPLTYWLAAAAFRLFGPGGWARLVTVALGMLTLVATCRLGARLLGARAGLLAGAFLATMVGFVLEVRTLRPDGVLMAAVTIALLCWHHLEDPRTRNPAPWLVGLYAALGTGVLAKGAVPVIVSAIPIAVLTWRAHGPAALGRLRPGLGLLVLAAIVLPWHAAVSWRHPGFAWDYVVNQHLLFFLDKKFPRDSEGDPLGLFWGAFVARSVPWIALVPLAAGGGRAVALPWVWLAGVLGFFSLAPSRLEHYALPALPAAALLAARGAERLLAGGPGRAAFAYLGLLGAATAAGGAVVWAMGPRLFDGVYWIGQAPRLPSLTTPGGVLLVAAGSAVAWMALRRRPAALLAVLLAFAPLLAVLVTVAQIFSAPVFSWQPIGEAVRTRVPADVPVVFDAPEEYQIVGGLAFYAGRRITLLEVPGFVPPTYLEREAATMFLPRAEFARRWQAGERLAFVSNNQRRNDTAEGLVPGPYWIVARYGDRWLLSSFPLPGAVAGGTTTSSSRPRPPWRASLAARCVAPDAVRRAHSSSQSSTHRSAAASGAGQRASGRRA